MFRFDPTFLKLQKLIKMGEAGQSRDGESVTPLVGGGNGDNAVAPQVFNSLPALNEAASYITQATSYLGSCFSDYSVEYGGKDTISHPHELLRSTSGVDGNSPVSVCISPGERFSTSSEASTSDANSPSRESTEILPQATNAIVTSNRLNLNGISMFQGLIERARRTVRGSADDIGWLQRAPEMPPVEDGTDRFNKILEDIGYELVVVACFVCFVAFSICCLTSCFLLNGCVDLVFISRHGVHRLPNTVVYLLVPGSNSYSLLPAT
jgi:hypothetical protein